MLIKKSQVAWERFLTTGEIIDYLAYKRQLQKEVKENEEDLEISRIDPQND